MNEIEVIPGIQARTKDDFQACLDSLAPVTSQIHVDLIDGKALPSRTLSFDDYLSVSSTLSQILHLMVLSPKDYVLRLPPESKVTEVIFHLDWEEKPYHLFDWGKERGVKISLALCPLVVGMSTLEDLLPFAPLLHSVLVMGIIPGYSGQPFREESLVTIQHLRKEMPDVIISVDGGMTPTTALQVVEVGAERIFSTSFVRRAPDPGEALRQIKASVE